jgi:ferrous iron transport protein B
MTIVAQPAPAVAPAATPLVLLAGNPNSGKTTLFNRLTGARAKVANYAGVTVAKLSGRLEVPGFGAVELVDLPGTYSLSARSPEEQIAADALLGRGPRPHAVVIVCDATALARNLYLALQVLETGVPALVALTMTDEARAAGHAVDARRLAARLGVPVVGLAIPRGEGYPELLQGLAELLNATPDGARITLPLTGALATDVAEVEAGVEASLGARDPARTRALALWALLSLGDDDLRGIPEALRAVVADVRARAERAGRNLDLEIVSARYACLDELVAEVCQPARARPFSARLDAVLTHPVWGLAIFALVMLLGFQALFSGAEPAVGVIESLVSWTQASLEAGLPAGPLTSMLSQGVVAGVGNVITFVPQIALLFVFIGLLEDSGYLARVAFVIDRVMGGVGLNGKAFVPMLSGFACAIPAVLATRTLESRRDRLLTMLVVPLMSCSARLPIYLLVVATVFDSTHRVLGLVSLGALMLLAMYALSVLATLAAAAVLRRTLVRAPRPALVLELPPYRRPLLANLAASVWQQVRAFLVDAGTLILALTVLLWALLSYPRDAATTQRFERQRAQLEQLVPSDARTLALADLANQEAGERLRHSAAGRLGHALEPALAPLGFDWRIGVGILGAFAAREVFVSTLGIVFDVADADEGSAPLRQALRAARRSDGTPLMTPLSGLALMVFFVLACQCMSTLAVVRRESGSWRWPALLFAYMTLLAYGVTLLVYQGGRALGFGP